MSEVFISYRREDAPTARLLCDRLRSQLGKESIFWDLDSIDPGENFLRAIETAVRSCRVVIAIIGPSWNGKDAAGQRQLMDARDYVRFELLAALREGKPIIPVRVQSASMPTTRELPRGLKEFAHLNAIELSDSRWEHDVGQLTESVRRQAGMAPTHRPKTPDPGLEALQAVRPRSASSAVGSPWFDPRFLDARRQEWAQRLKEENERKQEARATNPPFYQRYSWWFSAVINFAACVGLAFIIVPVTEWLLASVLGWLSLSLDPAQIAHPILAVALCGVIWAAVYSGVAAAHYADDPALGQRVFFLRGLIGGWVLWHGDFERGPGLAGSFPVNVFTAWTLSRFAGWASVYFFAFGPDSVAYAVLAISTVLCAVWYLISSLDDVL